MAENIGSSDIWSDGVEKSENCRTQTSPLMLLLRRLPPRVKQQLPQRKRLQQRRPLLPRQRKRLRQRRLLLPRLRRPLLLKQNSLFYCLILQKTPTYLIGWSLFLLNSLVEQRAQIRRVFQKQATFLQKCPTFSEKSPTFLQKCPTFFESKSQIYSNLLPDLLKSIAGFTQICVQIYSILPFLANKSP